MLTSLIYYTFRYVSWYRVQKQSFFKEISSAYYEEFVEEFEDDENIVAEEKASRKFRAFSWHKVLAMMSRALANMLI